jgi:hypothetical protein
MDRPEEIESSTRAKDLPNPAEGFIDAMVTRSVWTD